MLFIYNYSHIIHSLILLQCILINVPNNFTLSTHTTAYNYLNDFKSSKNRRYYHPNAKYFSNIGESNNIQGIFLESQVIFREYSDIFYNIHKL